MKSIACSRRKCAGAAAVAGAAIVVGAAAIGVGAAAVTGAIAAAAIGDGIAAVAGFGAVTTAAVTGERDRVADPFLTLSFRPVRPSRGKLR